MVCWKLARQMQANAYRISLWKSTRFRTLFTWNEILEFRIEREVIKKKPKQFEVGFEKWEKKIHKFNLYIWVLLTFWRASETPQMFHQSYTFHKGLITVRCMETILFVSLVENKSVRFGTVEEEKYPKYKQTFRKKNRQHLGCNIEQMSIELPNARFQPTRSL